MAAVASVGQAVLAWLWRWAGVGILPAILVLSAVLRFWGLSVGIPFAPGVDEPVIVSLAVRMMRTGDLNPHFFDYPSLFLYIQLATACARFLYGAVHGEWTSLDQVGPEDFYLWGRAVTALLGVATTALVYACGTYWSRPHAGVAAALSAVFPLHVRESHYVLTDVPVTFFIALALLLSLRASCTPSILAFGAAGAAVGLAVATKYTAFLAALMPLTVAMMAGRGRIRVWQCAVVAVTAAAVFLIAAPYTILDLPGFLNGFAGLAQAYAPRVGQEAGWSVYLKHLKLAMTSGGLLLVFVGIAFVLAGGAHQANAARRWLLVVFPLVYFGFVSRQGLLFGRYLLPLMPFIALLMAVAIFGLSDLLRRLGAAPWQRAVVATIVTVLALWPQAYRAVGFNRQISRPSTHAMAYKWLVDNVPRGSKVVTEKYEIRLPERDYRLEGQLRLINRRYEEYVRSGTDYLIASSYVFGPALNPESPDPGSREAYERLFSQAREVYRVAPSGRRVGPEIRVYSVKPASPER